MELASIAITVIGGFWLTMVILYGAMVLLERFCFLNSSKCDCDGGCSKACIKGADTPVVDAPGKHDTSVDDVAAIGKGVGATGDS